MNVRKATLNDLNNILKIYEIAREYMRTTGNPTQWGTTYPEKNLLLNDIKNGNLYVEYDESGIHGVFAFMLGKDPTYDLIEDGEWLDDEKDYGTIHRVANDGTVKGVLSTALDFCEKTIENLRIDTHPDNKTMQHVIEKHGFTKCGIIYYLDGTKRFAYQRLPLTK